MGKKHDSQYANFGWLPNLQLNPVSIYTKFWTVSNYLNAIFIFANLVLVKIKEKVSIYFT